MLKDPGNMSSSALENQVAAIEDFFPIWLFVHFLCWIWHILESILTGDSLAYSMIQSPFLLNLTAWASQEWSQTKR